MVSAEVSYSTEYTSASVNRYPNCVAIKHSLICFGGHHKIHVYCIESDKMVGSLCGHKDRINCVKWIANCDDLVISSSADKTSIVWDLSDICKYDVKYHLIGHKESIIVCDSFKLDDNQLISISSSTDNCLKVWLNDKQINELFVNNFIFDLKICKNDRIFSDIVIISVGANETINLYQFNQSNQQMNPLIEVKGHEDWIRSVDIFETQNDQLLIATSSQDCFIRVHRIERTDDQQNQINPNMFSIEKEESKTNYWVTLETVLSGHEGWVSQVRWTLLDGSLRLLSVSIDKTMILWQPPTDSLNGVWMESVRVGEVGGNTLGFLGCAASSKLDIIIGYSFNGALHCWKRLNNEWTPFVAISGHFDEVTDIVWEPEGEYLLSCSNDQTTRLHSICTKNGINRWHELARPQIHGYEIKCLSMIGRNSFVSGADEKVLRVFRATKCFANSLMKISNIDISSEVKSEETAHCASVPTLGLSNCAVYEPERLDHEFKPQNLEELPTEETLLQNTLWPEIHKLYGHVFEMFSVATSNDRTIMASASKATKAEHANIILWDLIDAKQIGKLSSHQLTVTRIRFSSNDRYIVSASRDRTWALFERQMGSNSYKRVGFSDKTNGIHSRIIWDIAFTEDIHYFCSVSRDKTAIFWRIDTNGCGESSSTLGPVKADGSPLALNQSITAVDICCHVFGDNYLVAFGLENGNICLYFWNKTNFWTHLLDINNKHSSTINRLQFSPKIIDRSDGTTETRIASCGADRCLHIFEVLIKF